MLVLPLCPVYGLCAVILVLINEALAMPFIVFALLGSLACSAIEYGYSLACEKLFRVRLWDYGKGYGSVNGRIHLLFCAYWGALALVVRAWVQPAAERVVSALPAAWFPWVAALVLMDAAATSTLLYRFGRKGARMPGCPVARRVE